jgi:hypothetical protein
VTRQEEGWDTEKGGKPHIYPLDTICTIHVIVMVVVYGLLSSHDK